MMANLLSIMHTNKAAMYKAIGFSRLNEKEKFFTDNNNRAKIDKLYY